jgi:branched-chain amino acid transport system substrate-binding protein
MQSASFLRLLLPGAMLLGLAATAHAEDSVKIGVPVSISGRFASFGARCAHGVEMAGEALAHASLSPKVDFLVRDIQSTPQQTVATMIDLVQQQQVPIVLGPVASPLAAAAIPAWRQATPVWMVPGASTETLEREVGHEKLMFHTFPYAYHYYASLAKMLAASLPPGQKVMVLYSDDDYGRTHLPFIRKYFAGPEFKIISEEIVRTNAPDMNPVLSKVAATKPDIMVVAMQTTDGATLARQVYARRLPVPYLVATAFPQYPEWKNAVGDAAAEGWIGVGTYLPGVVNWPANPDHPDLLPSTAAWEKLYRAKYNAEPNQNDLLCYVNAIMLALAVQQAGGPDKEKIASALRGMDMTTTYGKLKFARTEEGTDQQAFFDLIVSQRQNGRDAVLYPPEQVNAKLVPLVR